MTEGVEIKLTQKKCLEFFHNALCNGLSYISGYGISLECNRTSYNIAKEKLENPCIEDVYIQVLKDGGKLKFVDNEGDETISITLETVLERLPTVEFDSLLEMIQEQDDAETADIILQTVVYGEVQFG